MGTASAGRWLGDMLHGVLLAATRVPVNPCKLSAQDWELVKKSYTKARLRLPPAGASPGADVELRFAPAALEVSQLMLACAAAAAAAAACEGDAASVHRTCSPTGQLMPLLLWLEVVVLRLPALPALSMTATHPAGRHGGGRAGQGRQAGQEGEEGGEGRSGCQDFLMGLTFRT